jgi:hypothetical protein
MPSPLQNQLPASTMVVIYTFYVLSFAALQIRKQRLPVGSTATIKSLRICELTRNNLNDTLDTQAAGLAMRVSSFMTPLRKPLRGDRISLAAKRRKHMKSHLPHQTRKTVLHK